MKRPWTTWVVYGLAAAAVIGATAWISQMTVQLDRRDALQQQQAAYQENLRLALWRMDSFMMALIAREDARPPAHYQAFYAVTPWLSSRGDSVRIPSPLLSVDAPLVYVHFLVGPEGGPTSPQIRADPDWVHAISLTGTDRINRFRDHLDNLANNVGIDTIRAAAADLPAYASIDLQRTASGTV
ncbi:MAG: hypothetical protein R3336_01195, partial [Phycisphaeraceae bacterium]|nr:hypothetical protein [Phycisphaeraceae bacterium]